MTRVLIITASTGGGHNSVASALGAALYEAGNGRICVDVVDFLARPSAALRIDRIGRLYGRAILHTPRAWGALYHLTNREPFWRLVRPAVGAVAGLRLASLLSDRALRAIVCVHPLCTQLVAHALPGTPSMAPLVTVLTDLNEAHAAWVAPKVSLYVAPSREIEVSLLARGVGPRKIVRLGLPLEGAFWSLGPDQQKLRRELGLAEDRFTVLLTGGSEGAGAILAAARAIAASKPPLQIVVACGRNEALHAKLTSERLPIAHLVLGFTTEMPRFVRAADVVVGKAGALTIGEAVAARRPMIVLRPLPGQETGNMEFARRHGAAVAVAGTPELVATLKRWHADPGEMGELVARGECLRAEWSQAAARVACTVLALGNGKEVGECLGCPGV